MIEPSVFFNTHVNRTAVCCDPSRSQNPPVIIWFVDPRDDQIGFTSYYHGISKYSREIPNVGHSQGPATQLPSNVLILYALFLIRLRPLGS